MIRRVLGILLAALAVAAAGCSDEPGGDSTARAAVVDAIRAVGDPVPQTIRLRLPHANAEDLYQLSLGIDFETAKVYESASITIENDYATNPLEAHFALLVELDAGSVEARQIEDELYLRGDLVPLARALGQDLRPFVRFLSRRKELRQLVPAVLRGGWIHVYGAGEAFGAAGSESSRARSEQAANALAAAVAQSAAVTSEGSDEAGARYHVEVDLARFAQALFEAADGLVPEPPQEEIDALPDETVSMDVWLHDGDLRRIEVDVVQLAQMSRGDAAIDRDPLILRVDVRPFDVATLKSPQPAARLHALAFFRILTSGMAQ